MENEMGLLKRAAGLCLVLQQGAPRSVHLKTQGLLHKTISLLKNGMVYTRAPLFWHVKNKPDGGPDREPFAEQVIQELASCAGGIISPYLLFNRVREHLGLAGAALFLFDRLQNIYLPWSWYGISANLAGHLCLETPTPEIINRLSAGNPFVIDEDSPFTLFKQQDSLTPLMLAPVIYQGNLIALFMVFHAEQKIYDLAGISAFLAAACRFAAPLLYQQRERVLSSFTSPLPQQWQDRKQTIGALYGECKEERLPLYVLITSFKTLSENIQAKLESVNPDCFFKDLLLLVNSLMNGLGAAYPYRDNKIALFFKGYNSLDPTLLLHQVFFQIKSIYSQVSEDWKLRLPEKPTALFEEEKDLNNVLSDYV